jgi:hypothetical protein
MVSCDELIEGMVLARPAVSPQGQLLAAKGTAVTSRHMRLFKMWGVTEVDIEGHEGRAARPATPLSETERRVIEETIGQRFEGALGHPAMMEIARVATQLTLAREVGQDG